MNLRLIRLAPARPFDDVGPEQIARYLLVAFLIAVTAFQLEWVWWLRVIAFGAIGFGLADYGPKPKSRRTARVGVAMLALAAVGLVGSKYFSYVMNERSAKITQASGRMPPLLAQEQRELKCGDDWPVCSQRDYAAALQHRTTWLVNNGIALDSNDTLTQWVTSEIGPEKTQAAIVRGRAAADARP